MGIRPAFLTGANAKLKMGKSTVAYAQDVSYNIVVATVPIETMGRYEVVSNEPVAYFVDGTLSIVRYSKQASSLLAGAQAGSGTLAEGNSSETYGFGQHFRPNNLLVSTTFNLEIFAKLASSMTADTVSDYLVLKVFDCRLTRRGGGLNKRGIWVEQFEYKGILEGDEGDDVGNASPKVGGSGDSDSK